MFQKKTNIEIIGFKLVHFGFSLVLSDIDLQNIGLLDTHLDLLDTNIPSNLFVSLQDILKTSSRHLFKTSSIHVFKTSSRHVFKTLSRRFQRNNFSSSKTSSLQKYAKNGYPKDVLKTFWRHVFKTSSRRLEDQQLFAGKVPPSVTPLIFRRTIFLCLILTKAMVTKLILTKPMVSVMIGSEAHIRELI